jgi:hypothetical protein
MRHLIVISGDTYGPPDYVARNEMEAKDWLDLKQKELEKTGHPCERHNSLWLEKGNNYRSYRCYNVPCSESLLK